jgi:tRNA-dihydrouridine synthase A
MKAARADLTIVINGGIASIEEGLPHLDRVDGVMLGRAAYQRPYLLAEVDRAFFAATHAPPTRAEVAAVMADYADRHVAAGGRLGNVARHMINLYHGRPRGRLFRRYLSENAYLPGADGNVIRAATSLVEGSGAQGAGRLSSREPHSALT